MSRVLSQEGHKLLSILIATAALGYSDDDRPIKRKPRRNLKKRLSRKRNKSKRL